MLATESEHASVEEIAAQNPRVDIDEVMKAARLVEDLRKDGMARPEYNIESPYRSFPRRS